MERNMWLKNRGTAAAAAAQAMATAGCSAAAAAICDAPVARAVTAAAGALLSLQGLALGVSVHTAATHRLLPQALLLLMFAAAAAAAVFSLARCV